MDDNRLFPVMEVKEDEKDFIIVNCNNCGGGDLIYFKDYEHGFDNESEKHNGFLCDKCGCFHFMEDDNLTFEHSYRDIFLNEKEVKWNISDN